MRSIDELNEVEISSQRNAFAKEMHNISLLGLIRSIQNGTYEAHIQSLRDRLARNDKRGYDDNKKRLEAVAFSGQFNGSRGIENLSEYNRICVFDLDHLHQDSLKRLSAGFRTDSYILAFWISPSGTGVKGLVRFGFPEAVSPVEAQQYHKFGFDMLRTYFSAKYEVELDSSGSDVSRLCFVSSDPNLCLKTSFEDFVILTLPSLVPVTAIARHGAAKKKLPKTHTSVFNPAPHLRPISKNLARDRFFVQKCVKYLKKRKISITHSYERWYRIAYAIANSFTYDLGIKYFLQICEMDGAKHDEVDSTLMLQYCYENSKRSISIATLWFYFNLTKESRGELFRRGRDSSIETRPEY